MQSSSSKSSGKQKNRKIQVNLWKDEDPVSIQRCLGEVHGKLSGPSLILIAAMHGNEQSGVQATLDFIHALESQSASLRGDVYAFAGNLQALERGVRYIETDLNRLWTEDQMAEVEAHPQKVRARGNEYLEQVELWEEIKRVMRNARGPISIIDLHTTSVKSVPFLIMADTLMNREFASHFPLPAVLGVEEYLHEPLLSYANDLGIPAFAFEAGQHQDPAVTLIQEYVLWLALYSREMLSKSHIPEYYMMRQHLKEKGRSSSGLYEMRYRHEIQANEDFKMNPGYENFEPVYKDEVLASNQNGELRASENGRIFMPLYQDQGDDGFFIIKRLGGRRKLLTEKARKAGFGQFLKWIPGIRRYDGYHAFIVSSNRFVNLYAPPLLKMMGYRRTKRINRKTVYFRRKHDTAKESFHPGKS